MVTAIPGWIVQTTTYVPLVEKVTLIGGSPGDTWIPVDTFNCAGAPACGTHMESLPIQMTCTPPPLAGSTNWTDCPACMVMELSWNSATPISTSLLGRWPLEPPQAQSTSGQDRLSHAKNTPMLLYAAECIFLTCPTKIEQMGIRPAVERDHSWSFAP